MHLSALKFGNKALCLNLVLFPSQPDEPFRRNVVEIVIGVSENKKSSFSPANVIEKRIKTVGSEKEIDIVNVVFIFERRNTSTAENLQNS